MKTSPTSGSCQACLYKAREKTLQNQPLKEKNVKKDNQYSIQILILTVSS